jgi:aryl-alcohol dehydrogenase-like predicted oxidoreductase
VTAVVIGPRRPDQLDAAIAALELEDVDELGRLFV